MIILTSGRRVVMGLTRGITKNIISSMIYFIFIYFSKNVIKRKYINLFSYSMIDIWVLLCYSPYFSVGLKLSNLKNENSVQI